MDKDPHQPRPGVCDRRLYSKPFWSRLHRGRPPQAKDLYYAARVRAGFVPTTRRQVFDAIKHLKAAKCPFVNLPEKEPGRWGEGFTAEKMKEAVWLKPQAVAQIEFL